METVPSQTNENWQHVAPRLYLDTCTLIDALLEPPRPSTATDHGREIYLAQRVFEKWPPMNLIVSPYVIGEFVQKGLTKFSRTMVDMRRIVDKQIFTDKLGLPGCRVTFARFDVPLADSYAAPGLDAGYMMTFEFHGNARDESGRTFASARLWVRALRNGKTTRGIMTSLPRDSDISDIPDPETVTFDPDASLQVEAPAYEFLLFDKAARLVAETGVNWKDAFHYLYAGWENADSILTTDETLINQSSQNKNLPRAEKPSTLEARLKGHGWYDRLHTAVFGS